MNAKILITLFGMLFVAAVAITDSPSTENPFVQGVFIAADALKNLQDKKKPIGNEPPPKISKKYDQLPGSSSGNLPEQTGQGYQQSPDQQANQPTENQQSYIPEQQRAYPNQQSGYPNQQSGDPNQQSGYPNQQSGYPNQQTGYPNQQSGYPNQQSGYTNQQAGYPNQQSAYPDQQSAYPNQQSTYPNQAVLTQPQVYGNQPQGYGNSQGILLLNQPPGYGQQNNLGSQAVLLNNPPSYQQPILLNPQPVYQNPQGVVYSQQPTYQQQPPAQANGPLVFPNGQLVQPNMNANPNVMGQPALIANNPGNNGLYTSPVQSQGNLFAVVPVSGQQNPVANPNLGNNNNAYFVPFQQVPANTVMLNAGK